jgi:phage terminase large subunit-like protein
VGKGSLISEGLDLTGLEGFQFENDLPVYEANSVVKVANSAADIQKILKYYEILKDETKYSGFRKWFVPGTPYGIDKLPKHKAFMDAGNDYFARYLSGSNRSSKTVSACFESTLHLTGLYPDWWEGKRFDKPTSGWAAADTAESTKNIIQKEFLGEPGSRGTGMIPADLILNTTAKSGVSGAVDTIVVKHVSGGVSNVGLKTYEQGIKSFYGTAKDWCWLDELPPIDIFNECAIRLMTTNGIIYVTATPLEGLTPLVLDFYLKADFLPKGMELPGLVKLAREDEQQQIEDKKRRGEWDGEEQQQRTSKAVVVVGWDDAPWLTEDAKKRMLESTPEHLKAPRSTGLPSLGSGSVYPIPLEEVVIKDFEIPKHYKRVCGLDVGWNFTAAGWIAQDPDTGVCYLYSEYKKGKAEPIIHAEAIKRRGEWINCLIDPASRGRSQSDGKQIFNMYRKLGVRVHEADNAVEAGIYKVWEMLSTGQLKIFKSCIETQKEYLTYRRDEKGRIVKDNDHLMDGALRYPIMGLNLARQLPVNFGKKRGGISGGTRYDI